MIPGGYSCGPFGVMDRNCTLERYSNNVRDMSGGLMRDRTANQWTLRDIGCLMVVASALCRGWRDTLAWVRVTRLVRAVKCWRSEMNAVQGK